MFTPLRIVGRRDGRGWPTFQHHDETRKFPDAGEDNREHGLAVNRPRILAHSLRCDGFTNSAIRSLPRMKLIKKQCPRHLLVILGLSYVCTTVSPAWSADPNALEGRLTAYQFDGVYSGTSQRVATTHQSCRTGQDVALEVHDGRFKLPWNDREAFDARVRDDGSFYAITGASPIQAEKHMTLIPTLQGRIGSTGLLADYGTRLCRYRLEASLPAGVQRMSQRTDTATTRP
jgi:hypothetical protein